MAFNLDDLFGNDSSYVSPGSIGGKIKRIRELRGLTQKELGIRCGYSPSTADVRIAQYEKNKKTPREQALKQLAAALEVDESALYDADLLSQDRMYHALFDIEDLHALHPIEINGRYFLEFGGKTIYGQDVSRLDFNGFLRRWYEMYQQHLPSEAADNTEDARSKAKEYALWKYSYPQGDAEASGKRIRNELKMDRLQAELDALNAETNGERELERLDKAYEKLLKAAKKSYKDITLLSQFLMQVLDMMAAGMTVERHIQHEDAGSDSFQLLSFRTQELIDEDRFTDLFALFLCQIDTMMKDGWKISRTVTSRSKELFVTYKIAAGQYASFEALHKYWDDMVFIADHRSEWPEFQLKEYEDKLAANITGDNDVKLKFKKK